MTSEEQKAVERLRDAAGSWIDGGDGKIIAGNEYTDDVLAPPADYDEWCKQAHPMEDIAAVLALIESQAARIGELEDSKGFLSDIRKAQRSSIGELVDERDTLRAQLKTAREALEWYRDHVEGDNTAHDCGDKARTALKETTGEATPRP